MGCSLQFLIDPCSSPPAFPDNAASNFGADGTQSQGLVIELDFTSNSSKLVSVYQDPNRNPEGFILLSQSQGSFQYLEEEPAALPSSNVLLGYGDLNYLAEFSEDGTPLQLLSFTENGEAVQNYRGFKQQWNGNPSTYDNPSKIAFDGFNPNFVSDQPDSVQHTEGRLCFSWNGMANIKSWEIECGRERKDGNGYEVSYSVWVENQGFETSVATNLLGLIGENVGKGVSIAVFGKEGDLLGRRPESLARAKEFCFHFPRKGWKESSFKLSISSLFSFFLISLILQRHPWSIFTSLHVNIFPFLSTPLLNLSHQQT